MHLRNFCRGHWPLLTVLPVFALGFSGCGERGNLSQAPAFLVASTDIVDFGDVTLGESVERTVYFINRGDIGLAFEEPQWEFPASVFSVVLDGVLVLPGEDLVARVSFSPVEVGDYSARIIFPNDSSNETNFTLTLQGQGAEPGPCVGVDCSSLAPFCLNGSTSRSFAPGGQCVEGQCNNQSFDEACDFGCDGSTGLCRSNPCDGISCNTPPNDYCYVPAGHCEAGVCFYDPIEPDGDTPVSCNDSDPCTINDTCNQGVCLGTAKDCVAVAPAAYCSGSNLITFQVEGSYCNPANGACVIPELSPIFCDNGCDDSVSPARCFGNPCAGNPCDDGESCTVDTCTNEGGGEYSCSYALSTGPGGGPATCINERADEGCSEGICALNVEGGTHAICASVDNVCSTTINIPSVPDACLPDNVPGVCEANGNCGVIDNGGFGNCVPGCSLLDGEICVHCDLGIFVFGPACVDFF